MPIIALHCKQKKQIAVQLEIAYNDQRFPKPVPFVVDTAAERTFIVPTWRKELEKKFGVLAAVPLANPTTTLLGDLRFSAVEGLWLYAWTCARTRCKLNKQHSWACVANARGNKAKALGKIRVNILGRDILNEWALYCNLQMKPRPAMFLFSPDEAIDDFLAKQPLLAPYYGRPAAAYVKPSSIQWID